MRTLLLLIVAAFNTPVHAIGFESPAPFVIPSPYKVDRHGHSTGAAAAWNTQRLAGGQY